MSGISNWFSSVWADFVSNFSKTFIEKNRYEMFLNGLGTTLMIAVVAAIIGITIGVLVAIAKVYSYQTGKLKILDKLLNVYLAVFRGTPVVVQLMIMYYLVFTNISNGIYVAMLGFGINSGAYVAEIVRSGILSIDKGQNEAGRSLGLSAGTTMRYIVLPQAIKNILPALFNEFITLLKETSVAGYITVVDLTKAGDLIRSRTMEPFFSLIAVALIYFILVVGLTFIQRKIEGRLRKSDRR